MRNHITHALMPGVLATGFLISAQAATCQSVDLRSRDIGAITNVVISRLIPPDTQLSRVTIRSRGVFIDSKRTLQSFRQSASNAAVRDLKLAPSLKDGSDSLLADCNQGGVKPCNRLGWSAYVWVELLSRTDSSTLVRVHVVWPDRSNVPYLAGQPPSGNASLVGFSADMELVRSTEGSWSIVKEGPYRVGD